MVEGRPKGVAFALLILLALAITAAALLLMGYSVLLLAYYLEGDTHFAALLFIGGTSALLGCAFAMVAAALWRAIVGYRRHSHA